MFDLKGKKALITGATGGIGGEIAKTLNEAGAEIAISGTRLESLKALAETLGDRTHIFTCNLNDPLAIADLLKTASEKEWGLKPTRKALCHMRWGERAKPTQQAHSAKVT